jgi:hypothetical protein
VSTRAASATKNLWIAKVSVNHFGAAAQKKHEKNSPLTNKCAAPLPVENSK